LGDETVQFDHQAVGSVIRELRTKRGLSQELLSGFAGIARTHLTMIENGTKQPNFETIWRIAVAFEMRPSELVALIEQKIEETTSTQS
jgi:transcriptional regulator with XRE-family HTH domain